MKVYVIFEYSYDGTIILGVYSDREKAEKLIEDSNSDVEMFELDEEIFSLYKVIITLNGVIDECSKAFNKKEGVRREDSCLIVHAQANSKEEAIEIAKQKLKENTKMVEKLEWKE